MRGEPVIHFPPFRLDCTTEQLWKESQLIPLRPKPWAILHYLAEHPHRLVTKEELLKAIWPETYVSAGLLHTYIHDLRNVLGDGPQAPRFIETVGRRGYRFIAPLVTAQPVQSSQFSPLSPQHPTPTLVGREAELTQLRGWLKKTLNGERQVVFVSGELGIGKTTLVDAFLTEAAGVRELWVGRGQCIERYGPGEAYLPVLEALGRVGRAPDRERFIAVLRRHAPRWLVRMPTLVSETELEALQRTVQGTTRESMLRELAEALEVLTAERPMVLWLEDLQWSDYSTLDLLTAVAQRCEAARLLVLGTYRPTDLILGSHPLRRVKQELHIHHQCVELSLEFLNEADVARYLALRFPTLRFPVAFPRWLYKSTKGHPLFLVNMVEYWTAQGVLAEVDGHWKLMAPSKALVADLPESLRQIIERQVERLTPEEQRLLKAASVVGEEFAAATVAAVLERPVEQIEEWCEELARRGHFLRANGVEIWPDGALSGRYGFLHAFNQRVLYELVPAPQRLRWYQRIEERT